MGYIEEIRAAVGHRPLILPGAAVLVLYHQNRVLLQRRREGLWGVPGGFMELGESAEDTARRVVQEETGLVIGELTLAGVFSGQDTWVQLPNGDEFYSVTIAYISRNYRGEPQADGVESTDAGFFALESLPSPMHRKFQDVVTMLVSAFCHSSAPSSHG